MGRCFWFLWSLCALWLNRALSFEGKREFRSFRGIEEFLTTGITKEHKDGHVFLVFVVCVCFVAEQGFSRKEAQEYAKRKMEFGMANFRSDFCCLISAFMISYFLPSGVGHLRGYVRKF